MEDSMQTLEKFEFSKHTFASYSLSIIALIMGYITPAIIGFLCFVPLAGPYAIMFPMMVGMWSASTFVLSLILLILFKHVMEKNLLKAYGACIGITYFIFLIANPFLVSAFTRNGDLKAT